MQDCKLSRPAQRAPLLCLHLTCKVDNVIIFDQKSEKILSSGSTSLADWLAASAILDRLDGWQGLLAERQNLFAQYAGQEKA